MRITVDHNLEERVIKQIVIDADIEGRSDKGKIDFKQLKAGGIIKQRQKDKFTVRLKCPGGMMPLKNLEKVVEVAGKFGGKEVHFTTRQSLEIPYVDFHDFDPMIRELKSVGQEVASCGPRVRVPAACGGCSYNPNGLTDTQKMAKTVDKKFFGRQMNHKVKVSFSGCPADCIHTNTADIGFQGAVFPSWDEENCTGCTICASACIEDAIIPDPVTGKPGFDADKCLYCSDCVRACPTNSWKAEKTGHLARVGGKHGRHPLSGEVVAKFLTDEEAVDLIDATLDWYKWNGEGKGRVRLGVLLREDGAMEDYMQNLEDWLGPEKLVKGALAP
ncbi:MAG: 4Fe-4S binding protein, partial [Nitrospinota bacterium]